MQKTKWQRVLESPKGGLEYNPNQSFALQVFWVVRSPAAAKEMIEQGFAPCAKATLRDTPTTLMYFFRISQDQTLAEKLKSEVKTIGQHPHYQPSFKSLQMGIPKNSVEMKLKHGGIDVTPLGWSPDEPITGHEKDLDFDPVVLECTEVYLDTGSFYQHTASHDWMKSSAEILKASRSLKPITFCVGHPETDVWEKALESYLKAIRFLPDENKHVSVLQPGVFFHKNNRGGDQIFFLELNLSIATDKLETVRGLLSVIQQELESPCMIIIPTNLHEGKEVDQVTVRVMLSFPYVTGVASPSLEKLTDCCQVDGQLIVFEGENIQHKEKVQQRQEAAQQFLSDGLKSAKISILDGHQAEQESTLAGYPLHPLYQQLISNDKYQYKM